MTTKLDWDAHETGPPPPRISFETNNSSFIVHDIDSAEDHAPTKKRFVARVKNVCMAIPFDEHQTLQEFQKEVVARAASHRKLQKESKLASRIQYIKLATPHFPELVDCFPMDVLCEIATETDMIVFHTISDDEKDDGILRYSKGVQMESSSTSTSSASSKSKLLAVSSRNKKPVGASAKDNKPKRDSVSKRKSSLSSSSTSSSSTRPQTARFANTSSSSSSSASSKRKSDAAAKKKQSTSTNGGANSNANLQSNSVVKNKKKNRRNLSADLDQSTTKQIAMEIEQQTPELAPLSVPHDPPHMIPAQSVPNLMHAAAAGGHARPHPRPKHGYDNSVDLSDDSDEDEDDNNDGDDGNDSDGSARSGYSGHSGHSEDDDDGAQAANTHERSKTMGGKKKTKKKDTGGSGGKEDKKKKGNNELDMFAQQVSQAKRKTKKRNFEQEEAERVSRKNRAFSNHGRSISLSGASMLHSGDQKSKSGGGSSSKKGRKNTDSIYASNVQSKSTKADRRANAFEFFAGDNGGGGGGGGATNTDARKFKYRFGNRNVNVIRPTVVPYEEEQEQLPQTYLDLRYIHGFDGYAMESRQNMFISHDGSELIYPMARTGVMLNLERNTQRHWLDGREPISSIALHPQAPIIVTGHVQKGPDRAKLRVWNYKTLVLHRVVIKMHEAAVLCCAWSSLSGYLYSIGADETHKLIMWSPADLFKLDTKNASLADGVDHEDVINADVNAKKKNFVNSPIEIVSDLLLGKQDVLGFVMNDAAIAVEEEKEPVVDEFVVFGRKNVKYCEVRSRMERRNGRNVELLLPQTKTIVMGKLGSKSSEYERIYQSCCWLQHAPSWYLLGGHTGTIYICNKASCMKKVSNLGLTSQISCMLNLASSPQHVLLTCWDGKLMQLNVSNVTSLKLKKVRERMIYVPRSGDEGTGLKTFSPRTMVYHEHTNRMFLGLRTNQIIELNMDTIWASNGAAAAADQDQLHGTRLILDGHYGYVKCVAAHPFESYYVTGSDDSTLRIWDIETRCCLSRFKFDEKEKPSYLRFSHSGYLLAVGLTTSKIVILAWRDCNLSEVKAVVSLPFKIDKSLKKSQQMDAKNSEFTTDVTVIKWSSDDLHFAAGHIDAIACIFSVRYFNDDPTDDAAVFEHTLEIQAWPSLLDVSNGLVDMQWSTDNQWLLTFTKDQDLMVWFLNRAAESFEHYLYWLDPDKVQFADDPLMAGWDVEGVFQSYVGWDGTDLNAVSLTRKMFHKTSPVSDYDLNARKDKQQVKCKLLATADNKGYIRVHNYPAIKEAAHHYYSGHATQVSAVQWSANDEFLISVGGSDRSVFQWKLTNEKSNYIEKYTPLKSTNAFKK